MASKPATKVKDGAAAAAVTQKPSKSAPSSRAALATPQKKAAETITLKGVFEALAAGYDLPKKQAHSLLSDMIQAMTEHLKNGDRIRMNGLGILEVRQRDARMGRNPATGESIQIAASKKVAFRAAKELKDSV